MKNKEKNNKRIIKNVGLLYFRMLFTMVITLYTSRVVLQALGVEDYGIYNVVAGFVTMIGFLHGAMASATQRFLSYEIGKTNPKDVQGVFSMSLNIHILIGLFIFLLGETIGIWFLKNYLTIPPSRMDSAVVVLHFSLLSFVISIISVPFNALIISYEKMNIFAWVSILDAMLKLAVVFMLSWFGTDKLSLYSILNLATVCIISLIYYIYCRLSYPDSKYKYYWNKSLFNTMLSYTGWNLWGNIAAILSSQGVNILLNIFFGPSVNAARGVAIQVSNALNRFVSNVQVAVNPQIIKSYASSEYGYMHQLICSGSKYNFYILLILMVPVLNNLDLILSTWLHTVPQNTSIFIKLILYNMLINSLGLPLMTAAQATGKIKKYQAIVGGVLLLNLPLSYVILKNGGQPYTVFYIAIGLSLFAHIIRVILVSELIQLKVSLYIKSTILPLLIVSTIVSISNTLFAMQPSSSIIGFAFSVITSIFIVFFTILVFGLNKQERNFLINLAFKVKGMIRS